MIENILKKTGIAIIIISIVGSIIGLFTIDHEAYRSAKEIADELWDNTIAQDQYAAIHTSYIIEISMVIVSLAGGIISGLLLIGFSTLIELKRKNVKVSEEILKELKLNISSQPNQSEVSVNAVDNFINGVKVKKESIETSQ